MHEIAQFFSKRKKNMLKLKKIFLAMMVAAFAVTGFVSCSNDDDDDAALTAYLISQSQNKATVVEAQTDLYGTYTGTMNVTIGGKTTSTPATIKISADGIDQGNNYGAYTKVLWLKNTDGKYVIAAQSDSTNTKNGDLTVDNFTTASSCYVVFGDTITYTVPAMAAMGGTCTLTKLTAADKAYWYGTYTGTWKIMNQDFATTAIVANNTLYYQSSMMTGLYEYVSWLKDENGNWVCCGAHNEAPAKISDAVCTVTFDASTGKGSFAVTAMSMMGAAELTRAEKDTPLYTVSYSTEQGTAPSSVAVPENFVLTSSQLPALTADKYTFDGWYDGDTKAEAGSYKVTKNVTLTAKWADKTLAELVAATYTVNQNGGVYSDLAATKAMMETNATDVSLVVTKTDDEKVTVTIPEVKGQMGTTTMTIPSFDVTDVTVASADDGYTLSIGTYDSNAISSLTKSSEPVFKKTITVDGSEKEVNVYGLIATVSSDGAIKLDTAYTYGNMPFPFKVTFATASATTE